MSDVYEHNPGDHEDPMAGPTWTVVAAGAILLIVVVLGTAALSYDVLNQEFVDKVVEVPRREMEIERLRAEQNARLGAAPHRELRPENQEREESIVIPIDRAIVQYVSEMKGG